jgi:hypothetical protein
LFNKVRGRELDGFRDRGVFNKVRGAGFFGKFRILSYLHSFL